MNDFAPSRLWLPYGYWLLEDGSEVIFSRDYLPLWRIVGDAVERVDPWWWIGGIQQEAHFITLSGTVSWSHGPARALALQHLVRRRIRGLPRLLDAMPNMIGAGVHSAKVGLKRFYQQLEHVTPPASYARNRYQLS